MRCENFREIIDSFLSSELLVETNHEVVRHLDACEDCRKEMEARKAFRGRLQKAVINAPDALIDPAFAARLRSELRKTAEEPAVQTGFWRGAFSLKTLTASFAALFLTAAITGFVFLSDDKPEEPVAQKPTVSKPSMQTENPAAMWQKIAYQAIGDHQHCGLDKMDRWRKTAAQESAKKADFRENILQKTSFPTSEPMTLLHVHDCKYDGRAFTHAVIQIGDRVVSVLLTETELVSETNKNNRDGEPDSAIICRKQTGFQVASFAGPNKAVFVISDLPESENLTLARSLSNVMNS